MTESYDVFSDALARTLVPVAPREVERLPKYPRPYYLPAPPKPAVEQQNANFAWLARVSPQVMRQMDPAKKAAIEARYRKPD
jgi:hypothetical protein